jgi:SAM-dependent methyltransferase
MLMTKTKQQMKELRARAEECTTRNDKHGYDRFWADDELVELYLEPARVANFRLVADMCADWAGEVIDLGCGSGTMLQELLRLDRTGKKSITGIDYAASAVARCARILLDATFLQRDLRSTGLPDASFDLVLSIQTMEHLPEPRKAFDEMWRLMKPGARLIITVPNGEFDTWEGHCNFWTSESFVQMCDQKPEQILKFNDDRNLLFLFCK